MITLLIFNPSGTQIGTFTDYADEKIVETLDNKVTFNFTAPLNAPNTQSYLVVGNRVGYLVAGEYKLFIITSIEDTKNQSDFIRSVTCEGLHYELLNNLVTYSYTGTNLQTIFNNSVSGSGWTVTIHGSIATPSDVEDNLLHAFTLQNSLKAINDVAAKWQCEVYYTATVTGGAIASKTVHVIQARGATRAQQYTFNNAVESLKKTVDYSRIINRIYAKGAVTGNVNGLDTYVSIASVVWTTPSKPVAKPLGQLYIDDAASIAAYGLKKGVSIHNTDDKNYLIMAAYRDLQAMKNPQASYEISLVDLYRLTTDTNYIAQVGDTLTVYDAEMGINVSVRIKGIEFNPNDATQTKFTLDNYKELWDVSTVAQLQQDTAQNANPPFVDNWNSNQPVSGDDTIVVAKLGYKGTAGEVYLGYDAKGNQATALTAYHGDTKTVEITADGDATFKGTVTGSNVVGSTINGSSIVIGGLNNENGTLTMKNASGNTFLTMNNTGMVGTDNFYITTDAGFGVKSVTPQHIGQSQYAKLLGDKLEFKATDEAYYKKTWERCALEWNSTIPRTEDDSGTFNINIYGGDNTTAEYQKGGLSFRLYNNLLQLSTIWKDTISGTGFMPIDIQAPLLNYGQPVWHAGNFTPSNYLPIAGGTLTGLLITPAGNVSGAGVAGFQVGPTNSVNLAFDGNEIQARNNGAANTLYLNSAGGTVNINGYSAWHAGNFNPANIPTQVSELAFSHATAELKVRFTIGAHNVGMFSNLTNFGFYDWENGRSILYYIIADNAIKFSGSKLGFFSTEPVVKAAAPTAPQTAVTYTAPSTADYTWGGGTSGGYGFSSADEFRTMARVIANLQTRVAYLESTLQNYGLMA